MVCKLQGGWVDYSNHLIQDGICSMGAILGVGNGLVWASSGGNISDAEALNLYQVIIENEGVGSIKVNGVENNFVNVDKERQFVCLKHNGGRMGIALTSEIILVGVWNMKISWPLAPFRMPEIATEKLKNSRKCWQMLDSNHSIRGEHYLTTLL